VENERTGITHVPPGAGQTVWMGGGSDLIAVRATGEDTNGAFALCDSLVPPGAGAPPPHIHQREDEAWYVLEGEFTFLAGERWIEAGAGSFIYAPRGILHTFKNVGESVGRLLTLFTPAGAEQFFTEVGEPGTDVSTSPAPLGPEAIGRLVAAAERYGIAFPPPPAR